MLNRWTGILSTLAMLAVNAALIRRDYAPHWFASEPPRPATLSLEPGATTLTQAGLFDSTGQRIGYVWNSYEAEPNVGAITSLSTTVLQKLPLLSTYGVSALRVQSKIRFLTHERRLDDLQMSVHGLPFQVTLRGEYFEPGDFALVWQVGEQHGNIALPGYAVRSFGQSLQPFDSLPDLYVGQSWRMQVFNPLGGLSSLTEAEEMSTESLLVRVTREENLNFEGGGARVFRLEADRLRAWVAWDGRVIRQEIDLPLIGTLSILDEPYDAVLHQRFGRDGGLP